MCIFEAIDIASTVINMAATVVEVKSAYEEKKSAEHQTEVLVSQAKKAERNAAIERQEGIEEARRKKLNAILNMSEQKASIAASNLATSSQTSLNLIDDEKLNGELEALTTIKEAEHRYDSYLDSASKYYNEASLQSFNSKMSFHKKMVGSFKGLSKDGLKITKDYNKYKFNRG